MPQFNLPDNTPWWVVVVVAILALVLIGAALILRAVLPQQSAHRLAWWKAWWARPRSTDRK